VHLVGFTIEIYGLVAGRSDKRELSDNIIPLCNNL